MKCGIFSKKRSQKLWIIKAVDRSTRITLQEIVMLQHSHNFTKKSNI
ncbi:hypothetical protein [Holospora obtusa]|nr:hypothetical protein [Holospora obtusa]